MYKILILIFFIGCADKVDIKVKKISFLCSPDKYKNYNKLGGKRRTFWQDYSMLSQKGIFGIELQSNKNLNKYPNVQINYKNVSNKYDWIKNKDNKLIYSNIYFNPINPKELFVFTYIPRNNNFKLKDIKTESFYLNAYNMAYNKLKSNVFTIKSNDFVESIKKRGFNELSQSICNN